MRPGSGRSSSNASASVTYRKIGPTRRRSTKKVEYALRAAAMVRAEVDPPLLDEVSWWRTDDLWFWALEAW